MRGSAAFVRTARDKKGGTQGERTPSRASSRAPSEAGSRISRASLRKKGPPAPPSNASVSTIASGDRPPIKEITIPVSIPSQVAATEQGPYRNWRRIPSQSRLETNLGALHHSDFCFCRPSSARRVLQGGIGVGGNDETCSNVSYPTTPHHSLAGTATEQVIQRLEDLEQQLHFERLKRLQTEKDMKKLMNAATKK